MPPHGSAWPQTLQKALRSVQSRAKAPEERNAVKSIRNAPKGSSAVRELNLSSGSTQNALRFNANRITGSNGPGRSRDQRGVQSNASRDLNTGQERVGDTHLRVRTGEHARDWMLFRTTEPTRLRAADVSSTHRLRTL